MKLIVHKVDKEDVLRDLVRVHRSRRVGIGSGVLCQVTANGNTIIAVARNSLLDDAEGIWLDEAQRTKLKVKDGDTIDFEFRKARWYQEFVWVWLATDPVNRTAGRLGVISLGLGIIGVILGVWSVYLAFKPPS